MQSDTKEKDIVYSESVKAGKRIYYLDVKQSRNGDRYLSITESKKIVDDEHSEFPHFTFEKHKIFLYKEDFDKFSEALAKVIDFVRNNHTFDQRNEASSEHKPQLLSDANLHLDIDF